MSKIGLLNALECVFGSCAQQKNDEVAFFCPFCNHHKRKLQINLNTQKYHCWVCNTGGYKLIFLLKKLNVSSDIIRDILGHFSGYEYSSTKETAVGAVILPKEFKPLWNKSDDIIYKHAIKYLNKRNIGSREIVRYSIGYCDSGPYRNRIIIPSYDKNGKLNYFIGRDIFPDSNFKYKNPRSSKNVVPFELYINWNKPIILVEGVFDAIAVKINAIPLFGKFPSKLLVKTIIENNVKEIYIALDNDARKDAIKLCEHFMNYGVSVYLVDITEEDPSEMGFKKAWELINNTKKITFSDIIKEKLYV